MPAYHFIAPFWCVLTPCWKTCLLFHHSFSFCSDGHSLQVEGEVTLCCDPVAHTVCPRVERRCAQVEVQRAKDGNLNVWTVGGSFNVRDWPCLSKRTGRCKATCEGRCLRRLVAHTPNRLHARSCEQRTAARMRSWGEKRQHNWEIVFRVRVRVACEAVRVKTSSGVLLLLRSVALVVSRWFPAGVPLAFR